MKSLARVLAAALLALALFPPPASAQAAVVPRWSVYEVALTASRSYSNPYTDASVVATFRGPGGEQVTEPGFWDGGSTFRVRFTPTAEGSWSYTTRSQDPGLNGRGGTIRVTAPRPGEHGFVRRDPRYPYSFVYDDGTHYFLMGTTYYDILANAMAGDEWKRSIDGVRAHGIDKVRMHILSAKTDRRISYPKTSALRGDGEVLNLAQWRKLDEVVAYMNDRGVVADLIIYGTPSDSQKRNDRLVSYILARYAAYPNVAWTLTNEWNYTKEPRPFWTRMGEMVRREDPWSLRQGAPRMLSIHQQTRIDFQFFDQSWPSHAIIQYGARNGQHVQVDEWTDEKANQARYRNGDEWGNAGIVYNLGHSMPVVNDEFGYAGEPEDRSAGDVPLTREKHRQILWGIYTAGGYGSTGDKYFYLAGKRTHDQKSDPRTVLDGSPYFNANWYEIPEYGDIQRLVEFFTTKGLPYWRMRSHNELVHGTRVYALAEPGKEYVVYAAAGGRFTLDLAPGRYAVRRYDPRTGAEVALGTRSGGASSFDTPMGEDWVVYAVTLPPR
jgi:hypothetical protein